MIDHIGIKVRDVDASAAFYERALAPLGYTVFRRFPEGVGFWADGKPDFWISKGEGSPIHVCFRASTRKLVDAFHAAALEAGGRDHGAPGVRAHYHPHYYGGFVLDPDGHNVEAACHEPYLG